MASVVGLSMKRVKSKADASKKADNKLSAKKGSERASKKPRKLKAAKDPNKPKRPPSSFFVFMEEFRKSFKEKNPNNKSVSVVDKAGGDKWKSMSEDEKVPYVTKAAKLKTEYTKKLTTYNNNQSGGGSYAAGDEDEFYKSKSEVNDDERKKREVKRKRRKMIERTMSKSAVEGAELLKWTRGKFVFIKKRFM